MTIGSGFQPTQQTGIPAPGYSLKKLISILRSAPGFPGTSYKEVAEFIIRRQTIQILYNKTAMWIGAVGIMNSLIAFIILLCRNGEISIWHTEFFPSAIWSTMVTAFNAIEYESRKKSFFVFTRSLLPLGTEKDAKKLLYSYKEFTWEVYKDTYK